MTTFIIFIFVLGVLVFVHELGHFLVARRNGIKAEEFGFGFPPRLGGVYFDDDKGKWKLIWGNKKSRSSNTVYSLNWIPLGGFVRIKGEDGGKKADEDSFASKSAWTRVKVLAAGVTMNFILAWFLISVALMIGSPQPVEDGLSSGQDTKIQISQVLPGTPAEEMGLLPGDEIVAYRSGVSAELNNFESIENIQQVISEHEGEIIVLVVRRGNESLELSGTPRIDPGEDRGPLGISLLETAIKRFPLHLAIWEGLVTTLDLIVLILVTLYEIIKNLVIGQAVSVDVAGPVGIAFLTQQVTALGLVYLLQFTAILSINLGIINAFPIPALDGGRILFILIEKVKGAPVSQKVEQWFHAVGFILLILLMVWVTIRDFIRFEIFDKVQGIF